MKRIVSASLLVIAIFFAASMNYIDRVTAAWMEYHAYDEVPPFPGYLSTMNILHDCVSDLFPYYGYKKIPDMSKSILIINNQSDRTVFSLVDKKTYSFRNGTESASSDLVNEEIAENTENKSSLYTYFFGN